MNNTKEVRIVLIALLVTTLFTTVAAYEENIREDIYLVRPDNEYLIETTVPTYLENEDLIFFACLEADDTPLRLSFVCTDTNEFEDIPARRWGTQNCYIGSTNLEKFDCTKGIVQADYIQGGENLQLTQEIRINRFSKTLNRIIESQFEDGGWETPLDTAYGLLAISHYPDIFPERINKAIEYLKTTRDEEEKCWPNDNCVISTTATILFLLEQAGFEDLRIQHDGRLWLEKTQNYLAGQNWSIIVQDHPLNENLTLNTSCVYEYDGNLSTFTLRKHPANTTFTIIPTYNAHIGFVCTENVVVELRNEYNEYLLSYQGDNFSHDIPRPCWTLNNENISCDIRATAYSISTGIVAAQKNAADNYLQSLLVNDRTAGQHLENNWSVINDALYLYAKPDPDVETALLYYQNNSGAWSMRNDYYDTTYFEISDDEYEELEAEVTDQVSKDIVATGYGVMALLKRSWTRDDEPIIDAERWVSLMEDLSSMNVTDEDLTDDDVAESYRGNLSLILNDTKRNGMAHYVLQHNARPLLLARPRTVVMNAKTVELDVVNPTIFELEELTYELSNNLEQYLLLEEKDYVGAYSFRRITISQKKSPSNEDIGYLRILQNDNEYLKVPIILQSTPRLNITLPERMTVFGATAILPFNIDKSSHNYTCSLQWSTPGISSQTSFDINNVNDTYNFPVRFSIAETENAVYEGTIECVTDRVTFKIPIATNIIRFSNRPLQVRPELLTITEAQTDYSVTVRNLLDEGVDVTATMTTIDPYILISEPYFTLYPGQEKNLTVTVIPPETENYTTTNNVIFTTYDVEERIFLDIEVAAKQPLLGITAWIILVTLSIIILAVGGYFGWRYRDEILEWYNKRFHQESTKAKVLREVEEIERQEEITAMRNMVRILKLQGLKDTEVRARLEQEGYTAEYVNDALSTDNQRKKEES